MPLKTNHCFGCGPANPQGLHLLFEESASDDGSITTTAVIELTNVHEGPPGYVHGGIIATLLDEAMSKVNRALSLPAVTRHMEIDYLRPAPLGTRLRVSGRYVRREGRKLFNTAELASEDGRLLASAKGVFVIVNLSPFPGAL